MRDTLDLLIRFWGLRARHATAGEPLDAREQIELLSLMQLMTGEVELPRPGSLAPTSDAMVAQLIGEGTIAHAEIRRVSAAGILVSTNLRVAPGARFLVKSADPIGGVEYTLPCKVIWVHGAKPASVALAVDGVPTSTKFSDASGPARTPPTMALGRSERLVG